MCTIKGLLCVGFNFLALLQIDVFLNLFESISCIEMLLANDCQTDFTVVRPIELSTWTFL